MKNIKKVTTKELIDLADEIKKGITTEWIKRRKYIRHEAKPLLARQS